MDAPSAAPSRRERRARSRARGGRRLAARLLPLVAVLAGAGVGAYGVGLAAAPDEPCPDGVRVLRVAAAPEIAGVLAGVLEAEPVPGDDGACRRTDVTAVSPPQVAAALFPALRRSPRPAAPDVWVPDSSSWLEAGDGSAPSLATSAVVVAVTAAAPEAGGAARSTTVSTASTGQPSAPLPADTAALLAADAPSGGAPARRLVLPDPGASTVAGAVVAGLQTLTADRPELRAGVTRALRTAVPAAVPDAAALLETLTPDHAVPVPEQAVWRHNSRGDVGHGVTAVYPPGAGAALDYPWVVLTDSPAARGQADAALRELRRPQARAALSRSGFRGPDGHFADATAAPPGIDATRALSPAPLAATTRRDAAEALAALSLGSRMLAVIDVSGSMAARVDGGPRRIDLLTAAAATSLGVLPAGSQVGLWTFSTHLGDGVDHREVVPVGSLDEPVGDVTRAAALGEALRSTEPVENGGTALYDTALAAVREVRAGWDPRRVNSVVLLSDGRNEDSDSITEQELLRTLADEADPARPVPVITIAYGPDADARALARIAEVTAGAAYTAPAPAQIDDVFLDAVGRRVCRPDC